MASALVSHPAVGTVWLQNAEIVGDFVVGEVHDGPGIYEPSMATMNFPKTCVRRWEGQHDG